MTNLCPLPSMYPACPLKYLAPLRGEKVDEIPRDGEYIGLEQIESWTGQLSGVSLNQLPEGSANVFAPGDVLFGKLRPYLAKGWVADRSGYCTTEALVLHPDTVDPRYLRHCLLAPSVISAIDGSTYGSKMPRADWSFIGGLQLPMPPRAEQERIANFLDEKTARIEALITQKHRLAEVLLEVRRSTAYSLATRGRAAYKTGRRYREPWLPSVPAHWTLTKLRYVASIGNGSTPRRDHPAYWSTGGTGWLNSGAVNESRIRSVSDYVTSAALKECHLPLVRSGSTVIALTGQGKTRGTAARLELDTTISQHLAFITSFDRRVSDDYLWMSLTGWYPVLRYISEGEGSTKGAITCEQIRQLRLPIPPEQEQPSLVAEFLERTRQVDLLLQEAYVHIDLLQEYRWSLTFAAVAGALPTLET